MLEKLRKYLKETPREQLEKEWDEISKLDLPGPTVDKFDCEIVDVEVNIK